MKSKTLMIFAVLALTIGGTASPSVSPDNDDGGAHLKFKTMVAVTGPYVGPTNPIRGVPGGGLPWIISKGSGELKENGDLKVHVRGLVLPSPPFNFTNPVPTFRALVSCQCIDANGNPTIINVSTEEFPASSAGDCDIDAEVSLPQPCIAPIIFVTHPVGRWFAVTGR